eukprot:401373-Prymnesium_polylepis.2
MLAMSATKTSLSARGPFQRRTNSRLRSTRSGSPSSPSLSARGGHRTRNGVQMPCAGGQGLACLCARLSQWCNWLCSWFHDSGSIQSSQSRTRAIVDPRAKRRELNAATFCRLYPPWHV